jgi:DNA-directed RNA polymerase beta subunit
MSSSIATERKERRSYARITEVLDLPNLIEIQRSSFNWFLNQGLKEILMIFRRSRILPETWSWSFLTILWANRSIL